MILPWFRTVNHYKCQQKKYDSSKAVVIFIANYGFEVCFLGYLKYKLT